jgi:hypothetical protein
MRPTSLLNHRPIIRPAFALVLAVALLTTGCSSDGKPKASSTTSSSAATRTSAGSSAEAAVLDGYRGYWSAYLKAGDPMDPENTALREHTTGPALETVVKSFVALKSAGKVIRGQFDLAPRFVSADASTATVRDCYGDDTGVFDSATGAREDKATGQRHLVTATLRLEGGTWKVEQLADGGLGCTAA